MKNLLQQNETKRLTITTIRDIITIDTTKWEAIMKGLAKMRKEKRLTHREIANSLKLKVQTYRNYEYGFRNPKPETLKAMAKFFGCTIDELL